MRHNIDARHLRLWVTAVLTLLTQPYAVASTPVPPIDAGPSVVTLNARSPDTPQITRLIARSIADYQAAVAEKQTILIAKIIFTRTLNITLTETPRAALGNYASAIVVRNGTGIDREFPVGEMFSDQSLSIAYIAIVKKEANDFVVVLNYMSQPSEVTEGFVVVRIKRGATYVTTLPPATFGKVVFKENNVDQLDLWSAESTSIGTANDDAPYTVRKCIWSTASYKCGKSTATGMFIAPNSIIHPGVEVRAR